MSVRAYMRVSTEAQADAGTIENQREAIEAWAQARSCEVDEWYADEGKSGADGLDCRTALAAALADLRTGDTLVVGRLDRLARDLAMQEMILADAWRAGATVASCSEAEAAVLQPDDPADPARRLIRQIMGVVAEYERSIIRARTVVGRRRRIAEVGWCGGRPGIEYEQDTVAGVPVLSDLGREMIDFVLDSRTAGMTVRATAEAFNDRFGTSHSTSTIHRLIRRASRGTVMAG